MPNQVAPSYYTSFTRNQEIEFRNTLNDHMLIVVGIDGEPLEEDFPLLWAPMLRKNQLVPGYDLRTDRMYKLSQCEPEPWRLILNELCNKWARQQQQAQMQGAHMAAGQPQMVGSDHPQQPQMNGYSMPVDQLQVPGGYIQPQYDAMGVQSGQGTYMPTANSSLIDPALMNPSAQQGVGPVQHVQTPGWLQNPGLSYDQRQNINAAAT